jgi:ubiquinone/menaquinone biosynthesis C-methylase UbiE
MTQEFRFDGDRVALHYDNALVPVLFDPWARDLIEKYGPWRGLRVMDLATGTGIVAEMLASEVGTAGTIIAADISAEMLDIARRRCAGLPTVQFIECPADLLSVPDASVDRVVCQQGFQFFPNKASAAREIFRVLSKNGEIIVTTWKPVEECLYFGLICDLLVASNAQSVSDLLRIPFDYMPPEELKSTFLAAGFSNVQADTTEKELVFSGGVPHAVETCFSTPIGPQLMEWSSEKRSEFQRALGARLQTLTTDGLTFGRMVSTVLRAQKPSK